MSNFVKFYWDCKHCNKHHIGGDIRNCPNCGKVRDENTTFYPDTNNIEYVSDDINKNPDWVCIYCDQLNSDNDTHCISCGSKRTSENLDYFENEAKRLNEAAVTTPSSSVPVTPSHFYSIDTSYTSDDDIDYWDLEEDSATSYPSESPYDDRESPYTEPDLEILANHFATKGHKASNFSLTNFFISYKNIIIGILITALVITGLVFLFTPKVKEYTIKGFSWERSISIERYQTVNENDWSLPANARLHYTRREIRTYEQVIDHYETKTRLVTKTRITGYEERVTGYRNLGNGYGEEITTSYPVYETYQDTETYSEPVYRSEPVYDTKYYYEIDKWLFERYVKTNGNNKNPYWGETNLKSDEREAGRSESFYIIGLNEDEKTEKLTLSREDWDTVELGQIVQFKVLFGHGELIRPK